MFEVLKPLKIVSRHKYNKPSKCQLFETWHPIQHFKSTIKYLFHCFNISHDIKTPDIFFGFWLFPLSNILFIFSISRILDWTSFHFPLTSPLVCFFSISFSSQCQVASWWDEFLPSVKKKIKWFLYQIVLDNLQVQCTYIVYNVKFNLIRLSWTVNNSRVMLWNCFHEYFHRLIYKLSSVMFL